MSDRVVHLRPRLHAKAKARAERCGMTLKDWVSALINVELARNDGTPAAKPRWPFVGVDTGQ